MSVETWEDQVWAGRREVLIIIGEVWQWTRLVLLPRVWPAVGCGKKMWQKYKYCLEVTENETKGSLNDVWGRWINVEGRPCGWYESENSHKLWVLDPLSACVLLQLFSIIYAWGCVRGIVCFYPAIDGTWVIYHGRDNQRKLLCPVKHSVGVNEQWVIK